MFSWSFIFLNLVFLFIVVFYIVYKWSVSPFTHFSDRNIPHVEWFPFIGSLKEMFLQRDSFSNGILKLYARYKDHKYFGFYSFRNPILIVKDPDLIRRILVENFDHFENNFLILHNKNEPLLRELMISMKSTKWKKMRESLTPAFSTEKNRLMFYLTEEYCELMIDHLKANVEQDQSIEIDIKDIFTRFANDVIAAMVFGVKVNSLAERDNDLYKYGKEALIFSSWFFIKYLLHGTFQRIMKFLKIGLFSKNFTIYFQGLVLDTIKYRSDHNITRFDMVQLLMESSKNYCQNPNENSSSVKFYPFGKKDPVANASDPNSWTDNEIVVQCLFFFLSGFTRVSTLLNFTVLELATNPEIQDRLQKEIDQVKDQLNGKVVTYELLNSMIYLDMVLCEALRKWPFRIVLERICSKPYTLSDDTTEHLVQLKKDEQIWIPVRCLHFDPEYFPEPNRFNPERFSNENRGFIKPYTYLPFGIGPGNCICSKSALMICKAALFNLLSQFRIEQSLAPGKIKLSEVALFFFNRNNDNDFKIKLKLR